MGLIVAPLTGMVLLCNRPHTLNHTKEGGAKVPPLLQDAEYLNQQVAGQGFSCLKKSLPLSSTRMKAGKSSTVIFQMASMPSGRHQ